ncbi:uncharacterized protein V6R79_003151 [Siganus canaliculatus]
MNALTILNVVVVLGCLLSLALAQPLESAHQRVARSDSSSEENCRRHHRSDSDSSKWKSTCDNSLLDFDSLAFVSRSLDSTYTSYDCPTSNYKPNNNYSPDYNPDYNSNHHREPRRQRIKAY